MAWLGSLSDICKTRKSHTYQTNNSEADKQHLLQSILSKSTLTTFGLQINNLESHKLLRSHCSQWINTSVVYWQTIRVKQMFFLSCQRWLHHWLYKNPLNCNKLSSQWQLNHDFAIFHRMRESLRLEKTIKITESNC